MDNERTKDLAVPIKCIDILRNVFDAKRIEYRDIKYKQYAVMLSLLLGYADLEEFFKYRFNERDIFY